MKVSVFHAYSFGFLILHVKGRKIINLEEVYPILKYYFPKFPKKCHKIIIKEFIELGLLKRLNQRKLEILSVRDNRKFRKEFFNLTNSYDETFPFF